MIKGLCLICEKVFELTKDNVFPSMDEKQKEGMYVECTHCGNGKFIYES